MARVCLLVCMLVLSIPLWAQEKPAIGLKCVVLDPGHGGKDFGCISRDKKYNEKTIVLSVAKKVGKLINENYPDVKVIYTRNKDIFIPLAQRADIANKNKADLFISVHVNSTAGSTAAHGTETFTMGNHVSNSNFEISKRENSVILMEDDYSAKYEGFDPNSPESYIIFSLLQNAYSEQSIKFANMVQTQFKRGPIKYSRGVKQAGFLVLKNTTMPSVLVELGFISNPDDLKQLTSEAGQNMLARRLFDAFAEYKRDYESGNATLKEKVKPEKETVRETGQVTVKEQADKPKSEITYHIQIMSVGKKLNTNAPDLKGEKNAQYIKEGALFKYYVGEYASREDALKELENVRKRFRGAFIIGVKDGKIVAR